MSPESKAPQRGVLLINLGTPERPDRAAVRRYLREFLWDPRVVEFPRPLWWLVLHGIVLNLRPGRSAAAYRRVWTDEGSPLLVISRRQQARLAVASGLPVALGMRYGRPAIAEALDELLEAGVREVVVLPLYPQYSATTTATVFDALSEALRARRDLPGLRFIRDYHDHPAYIEALAASVRDWWQQHGRAERLLLSFHGIPRRYAEAGDPYPGECERTARLLAEALALDEDEWVMSFQSRLGREEWLRPYTDETLARLAAEGVRSVQVLAPGFAADCLETLEELAMENRDHFLAHGGERYEYIPALNDRKEHIALMQQMVSAV